jgi:hypothetical protein
LRDRFMAKMKEAPPRFIIEGQQPGVKPKQSSFSGWPALSDFIEHWYTVDRQGSWYVIYKRAHMVSNSPKELRAEGREAKATH